LIIAAIWPVFFFGVFYDLARLHFLPNEWWHVVETYFLIFPLLIAAAVWFKPIPASVVGFIVAPASFLWALSLVIAKHFDFNYLWPPFGQSLLLIAGGVLSIVGEQIRRRNLHPAVIKSGTAGYRWLAWLSRSFLILGAIALVSSLIWHDANSARTIFVAICLFVVVLAWILPAIGGIILTVGGPIGAYTLLSRESMSMPPNAPPTIWWMEVFFEPLSLLGMLLAITGILSFIWGWLRPRKNLST
jgi:hypothetical protein